MLVCNADFCFQLDVFHPLMYRYYMRKSDPEEPPKLEEPLDERDGRVKRLKDKQDQDHDEKMLEEKFYRLAISNISPETDI